MDNYLSNKLTFFSFWLIVLVVILHSLNVDFSSCNNIYCTVQYLVSHRLSQIAVPLFFMISGFLYFHKLDLNNKIDLSYFINGNKKRLRTVLVPYILWCTLWFSLMYVIQYLPIVENYFQQPLYEMSMKDKLLNLYYYPLNYPFYFLRELMSLFVISPLIYILIKHLKWFFIILVFLLFMSFDRLLSLSGITLLSATPLFYFGLGSFFSLNKFQMIFNAKKHIALLLVVFWLILNIISLYNVKDPFIIKIVSRGLNIFKDLVGCVSLWYLYDFLNFKKQWSNYKFYNYSFFIFAFHGIPTLILVKASIALSKENSLLLFMSYIIIISSMVIISILIGMGVKKMFPNLYNVLVGSRK